jgi:hypothetical protein
MIPTILVVGLAVGRWWLLPVTAVAWVVLLLATGVIGLADIPAAAGVALANAAVGVAVHKTVVWPFRQRRARRIGHT